MLAIASPEHFREASEAFGYFLDLEEAPLPSPPTSPKKGMDCTNASCSYGMKRCDVHLRPSMSSCASTVAASSPADSPRQLVDKKICGISGNVGEGPRVFCGTASAANVDDARQHPCGCGASQLSLDGEVDERRGCGGRGWGGGREPLRLLRPNRRSSVASKTFQLALLARRSPAWAPPSPGSLVKASPSGTTAFTLCVPAFRVISAGPLRAGFAEYRVVLASGARSWDAWRRHSQFRLLLNALAADSPPARRHGGSRQAWADVRRWQRTFRCLDEGYLAQKCALLEELMQQVLFESHSPALLMGFLSPALARADT